MPKTDAHPNLLIIMADQHAPMFSGPYGHSVVRTPLWIDWRQRGLSSMLPIATRLFASRRECRS